MNKIATVIQRSKAYISRKIVSAQSYVMTEAPKYYSKTGMTFVAGCAALVGAGAPAFAAPNDVGQEIANNIRDAAGGIYGAMKSIGVVVAVLGVAMAAFQLFFGGDKGMEKAKKTLLYTAIGCGILFLAVPIINFFSSLFDKSSKDLSSLTTK